MTDKSVIDLKNAIDTYLGDDDSANTVIIERDAGPAIALIRSDVLESLKFKAAQFDASDDSESDQDAFAILNEK